MNIYKISKFSGWQFSRVAVLRVAIFWVAIFRVAIVRVAICLVPFLELQPWISSDLRMRKVKASKETF